MHGSQCAGFTISSSPKTPHWHSGSVCCPGLLLSHWCLHSFLACSSIGTWSHSYLEAATLREQPLWFYIALGHGFHKLVWWGLLVFTVNPSSFSISVSSILVASVPRSLSSSPCLPSGSFLYILNLSVSSPLLDLCPLPLPAIPEPGFCPYFV